MDANIYTATQSFPPTTFAEGPMPTNFSGISNIPPGQDKIYIFPLKLSSYDKEAFDLAERDALMSFKRYGGTLVRVKSPDEPYFTFYLCRYEKNIDKNVWYRLVCPEGARWEEVDITKEFSEGFKTVYVPLIGYVLVEFRKGAFDDWVTLHQHEALDFIGMLPIVGTPAMLLNGYLYLVEGKNDVALVCFLGAATNFVFSIVGTKILIRAPYLENTVEYTVVESEAATVYSTGMAAAGVPARDAEINLYTITKNAVADGYETAEAEALLNELNNFRLVRSFSLSHFAQA